jgi:diguanylate cyclase (GGDEF)-like protein
MTKIANKGIFLKQLEYLIADFKFTKDRLDFFEKEGKPAPEELNIDKKQLSLAMMDVDNFKRYNDLYGHLEGDYALKKVANYFPQNLRGTDMMARYGGEEFVILMPNTNFDGAYTIYQRIAYDFQKITFKPKKGIEEKITFSGGVATLTADLFEQSMKEFDQDFNKASIEIARRMINAADAGLYQVKKDGKNNCLPKNCLKHYDPVKSIIL